MLALAGAWASAADAAATRYLTHVFPTADVQRDLIYGWAWNNNDALQGLALDLYQPAGDVASARPVVVYAHGGAFTGGIKEAAHDWPYPDDFARRGFVAASIDYRLDGSEQEATDDMQAAVRWFRANAAELRIDPDRIAVMGSSAGAIMALSATFEPEDPGTSGNPEYSSRVGAGLSISGAAQHPTTITPGDPPIAMFHAKDDRTVPYAKAQATCEQTRLVSNVCELYSYEQGGHPPPFAIANRADIVEKSSDFLARNEQIDLVTPTTGDDVPAGYRHGPVTVTLAGADTGGAGFERTYYMTGVDPPEPTTSSAVYDPAAKPVLGDGERIRYFSIDRAGNAEAVQSSPAAKVDGAAPSTSDDVPAGYQRSPVSVTLDAADTGGSGLEQTYYETGTDPADPTTASPVYDPAARPVLGDGERIRYYSTDRAGNAEPVRSSRVAQVDEAAPRSQASAVAATESPTIAVDYTAADTGSGLERVVLYVSRPGDTGWSLVATDSSPAETGHGFSYTADAGPGEYGFYTVAYDTVGNAEALPASPDTTTSLMAPPEPLPPAVEEPPPTTVEEPPPPEEPPTQEEPPPTQEEPPPAQVESPPTQEAPPPEQTPPPEQPSTKPQPPPTKPAQTRPVAVNAKTLTATRKGVVTIAVANPNPFKVAGTLRIGIRGKKRMLGLGRGRFSIAAKRSSPARITLSGSGLELLTRRKQLSVRVLLSTPDTRGRPVVSWRWIVLTAHR